MTKRNRARIILSQVRGLDPLWGTSPSDPHAHDSAKLRIVEVKAKWRATIQRGRKPLPDDPKTWDLLTIEAGGELKLSIRFLDNQDSLILYRPGHWETWFSTFDPHDNDDLVP